MSVLGGIPQSNVLFTPIQCTMLWASVFQKQHLKFAVWRQFHYPMTFPLVMLDQDIHFNPIRLSVILYGDSSRHRKETCPKRTVVYFKKNSRCPVSKGKREVRMLLVLIQGKALFWVLSRQSYYTWMHCVVQKEKIKSAEDSVKVTEKIQIKQGLQRCRLEDWKYIMNVWGSFKSLIMVSGKLFLNLVAHTFDLLELLPTGRG